jgi:8-oxo-dGTP diphosphatase
MLVFIISTLHSGEQKMPQPLIVTAAIIRKEGKILITQRPPGRRDAGKWEFPGGKLNDNETPEECLRRELREELNMSATVGRIFRVLHHRYEWGAVLLLFYECAPLTEKIENLEVADHRFVNPEKLDEYDILEADRPLIKQLQSTSNSYAHSPIGQ